MGEARESKNNFTVSSLTLKVYKILKCFGLANTKGCVYLWVSDSRSILAAVLFKAVLL